MRLPRRKWLIFSATALLVTLAVILAVVGYRRFAPSHTAEARVPMKPEAPPDLEKLRDDFNAGLAAFRKGDVVTASRRFASFTFKARAVEEYRLYYLGRSLAASHDLSGARGALAQLWNRSPRAVFADDAGNQLAALYASSGDWAHSSAVYRDVATRSGVSSNAASANWGVVESSFHRGDVAMLLDAARDVMIKQPNSPQAAAAIGVARSVTSTDDMHALPMLFSERLERAVGLLRDHNPASALDELSALGEDIPTGLRDAVALNRGLALNQLRRYEESNRVLEPLTAGAYKVAIPALYTASKNYRSMSTLINPIVLKTVMVKQQVGTTKVKSGKGKKAKLVTKPKFANVKKTVQLVDLAKKAKKEEYDRLASERLRDILQLPQAVPSVRLEILNQLIPIAEAKNEDAYEQQLIQQAVKIDRDADPGLQHFWDKAWAAYLRDDLRTSIPLLKFIAATYANPNVRRQSDYWYARAIERAGAKPEADEIYHRLASAPYQDVYALYSKSRGGTGAVVTANPTAQGRPDWREIAEKSMPSKLRLAHELTALEDFKDAALETEKNATPANHLFADALRAEKLNNDGNLVELYRALRRAFPLLATVEQDAVPPYFLRMYYPVKYQAVIRKNAAKQGVDPYLMMALILQESYFNPRARSRVGAMGLMQIMPATGNELGRQLHGVFSSSRLEDPQTNIEIGAFHLKHLLSLFNGDVQLVAASYNAGQGNVLKWRRAAPRKPMDEFLESIPFPETRNYVKRVTLIRSAYTRIAN